MELTSLDQLETLRHHGGKAGEDAGEWMHAFSEILLSTHPARAAYRDWVEPAF